MWQRRRLGWQSPLPFRFLIVKDAASSAIRLYFGVPTDRAPAFQSAFGSSYANVHLIPEPTSPAAGLDADRRSVAFSFRKGGHGLEPWLPLAQNHVGNVDDPLGAVLNAIGSDGSSRWAFEVWLTPLRNGRFQRTLQAKAKVPNQSSGSFSLSEVLSEIFGKQLPKKQPQPRTMNEWESAQRQAIRSRLAPGERPFLVSVRVFASGSTSAKAQVHAVLAAMGHLQHQGRIVPKRISKRRLAKAMELGKATHPMWWTSGELTSLVHLPDSRQSSFHYVAASQGLVQPPPKSVRSGLRLGWSNFPGNEEQEIRIPFNQAAKHTFLAGATGSGKTTTLLQIMLGLVSQMQTNPETAPGFTFFDPHGGAIERLLAHIPPSLHSKVHVIPLGPTAYPRGLNLFRMGHRSDAEAVTGEFVTTLQELWPGSRPRSEHYLRNNVLSLLQSPPQTILGIAHLFSDDRFRQDLIPKLPPHLQDFWTSEFAEIRNIADHLGPIWNKLGALTTYPSLRRILGQMKSAVDTRTVMDDGHIVLIDGSGCTTDAVKIIAGLYLIDLHFTCKRRPEHRSRLHIFLGDETHLYAVNVLQKILAEDRKFGLSLFLATQYLDQLPDPILAGILGNVGTLILLQLGGPDADRLTRWLKPDVSSRELMTLPEMNALVRTKLEGGVTELFTMRNPLVTSGNDSWAAQALAHSDRYDGRPADEVDREIEAMYNRSNGGNLGQFPMQ
ncbi:type IV secretory system conjugative DNA transfer family protein [Ferroacidibacillus organovorans]|uniref:type IV secretory system conjugative DNA transfer family protein n=1 Tax=Ferroacidibacillus organovorans TaxID=1765683 RepID=UPI00128F2C3E|nr:type IV secretion system DNA-binding domain-containing protein [Ferroacidibacillus organovorans]